MMNQHGWRKAIAGLAAGAVLVALSACGSSDEDSTSTAAQGASTQGESTTAAVDAKYTGPDAKYFSTLPEPEQKSGFSFKVGILSPSGGQPVLGAWENATEEKIKSLGGTPVTLDAQGDATKQPGQLDQLLVQGVDTIISFPFVNEALAPGYKKAQAQGVPVFVINNPPDSDSEPPANVTSVITQSYDYGAWATMSKLAELNPGAEFGTLGWGIPAPTLDYIKERSKYWGIQAGMKFVDHADSNADSASGYSAAALSLATKHPDVKVIATINDDAALAASTALAGQGKSDIQLGTSNGGQSLSEPALKAGRMEASYCTPWSEMASQSVIAAYDQLTKQHLPLPERVNLQGAVITKDNTGDCDYVG